MSRYVLQVCPDNSNVHGAHIWQVFQTLVVDRCSDTPHFRAVTSHKSDHER